MCFPSDINVSCMFQSIWWPIIWPLVTNSNTNAHTLLSFLFHAEDEEQSILDGNRYPVDQLISDFIQSSLFRLHKPMHQATVFQQHFPSWSGLVQHYNHHRLRHTTLQVDVHILRAYICEYVCVSSTVINMTSWSWLPLTFSFVQSDGNVCLQLIDKVLFVLSPFFPLLIMSSHELMSTFRFRDIFRRERGEEEEQQRLQALWNKF